MGQDASGDGASAPMPAPGDKGPVDDEELQRLRAERDALRHELEVVKTPRKRRLRRGLVGFLVLLSCLLVVLSVTVVWAHRTVLNTPVFVATVGPVLHQPGVDRAVAGRSTAELYTALDVKHRIERALPSKIDFAAGPIAQFSQQAVTSQLTKILASDRFQTIWTQVLTTTHEQLVAVLRGHNTKVLNTSNGYIVLNTVPIINKALGQISGLTSSLTGHHVTLPTITSAELPKQAVDKLSRALGVNLPSNFGQITLIKSDQLSVAQRGVRAFDRLAILLPILTFLVIVLALWLSVARRRTILQLVVGTSLLVIVVRRVVIYEQGALAHSAQNPQVAHDALGELLQGLYSGTAWVLWAALAIAVVALVTGPYRWAVAGRHFVRHGWDAVFSHLHGDGGRQTLEWVADHAALLQLVVAVVAVILLLVVSVSLLSFLIIGALFVLAEVYLSNARKPHDGGHARRFTEPIGVGVPPVGLTEADSVPTSVIPAPPSATTAAPRRPSHRLTRSRRQPSPAGSPHTLRSFAFCASNSASLRTPLSLRSASLASSSTLLDPPAVSRT